MIYKIWYWSSSSNSLKYTDNTYIKLIYILTLLLLAVKMNKVVDDMPKYTIKCELTCFNV